MNNFRVVVLENEFYVDEFLSNHLIKSIKEKNNNIAICFTDNNTLLGCYENLVEANKNGDVSFDNVKTFNSNEYIGVKKGNLINSGRWLRNNLFSKINLKEKNIFEFNENIEYPEDGCLRYEELIRKNPINIQLLALKKDGSLALNKPFTNNYSRTRVVDVEVTDSANYTGENIHELKDIKIKGITMGLSTIMKSKQLIVVAKGVEKARAVKDMLEGRIMEAIPATIVRKHDDVIVVLDKDAASELGGLYKRILNI